MTRRRGGGDTGPGERDDWVRDRLAGLDPPPRRRGFEDELWERIETRERTLARRWRSTSIVLAAIAVAAVTSAAVLATTQGSGTTVDRTFACTTQVQGGLHVFEIEAWPKDLQLPAAGVQITTRTVRLLEFNTFGDQPLAVDGHSCRAVKRTVPLEPAGLPSAGAFGVGYVHFTARCLLPGRLLVHIRLQLDAQGKPHQATLALRMERKNRPVSFFRWSAKRVTAFLSRACT